LSFLLLPPSLHFPLLPLFPPSTLQIIKNVCLQHAIQTVTGFVWMSFEPHSDAVDHATVINSSYVPRVAQATVLLLGRLNGEAILRSYGKELVSFVYWWGVPIVQFALAL
jgi:sphinganine C4-monooxygenase